jgi:predicted nucleic acid-binding protein
VAGAFLDTNVLVYAFTADPRAARAQSLLGSGATISIQGLNEFTNVARRKLGMNWDEIGDAVAAIRTLCPTVVAMDIDIHVNAVLIAKRHGFAIFDALMIASALRGGCDILWSEDMHDGMLIDGRLHIINPF